MNKQNFKRISVFIAAWFLAMPWILRPIAAQSGIGLISHGDSIEFIQPNDSSLMGDSLNLHVPGDSISEALWMIKAFYANDKNWENSNDPVKKAIGRIIFYIENGPLDTTLTFLKNYPFQIKGKSYPKKFKFASDQTRFGKDSLLVPADTLQTSTDSIVLPSDSSKIKPLPANLQMPVNESLHLAPDSSTLVGKTSITDTLPGAIHDQLPQNHTSTDSVPHDSVPGIQLSDKEKKSLDRLINYLENDSVKIWMYNIHKDSVQVIMKNGQTVYNRFWLKNELNDSLGIWIRTKSKNQLDFLMDDNVFLTRIRKGKKRQDYSLASQKVNSNLKDVRLRKIEQSPWEINGSGSILLSQVYLSNWSKGGEKAFSSIWKAEAIAKYTKETFKWLNTFRMSYGLTKQSEQSIRKNEDTWEINSEMGWKASEKWYYSAGLNLRSQFYKGYNYPNDSVVVSGFLSPGNLYSSLGFENKFGKGSTILLSPLTIKSVFVLDTGSIQQTKFGISENRKSKSMVGPYVKIRYLFNFSDDVSIDNRLHFFTSYASLKKMDFDWEMNLKIKMGPFFSVSFLTHTIYDSEVTFPVYDETGIEVGHKAKLQFKEWAGFGIGYKF